MVFAIKATGSSKKDLKVKTHSSVKYKTADDVLQLTYTHPNGTTPAYISSASNKDLLVPVSGYDAALRWWAPSIDENGDKRVLINGLYLVRGASVSGGSVAFTGDIDATTDIQVNLPDDITSITWNGQDTGTLEFKKPNIKFTEDLSKAQWKYSSAFPETDPAFDDSKWTTADHESTYSITVPETLPVLFADDYGYHTGNIWFRGTFDGSSEVTGLNLTCMSGSGSAWSARGSTKAQLLGADNQNISSIISWKVQGNVGGEDLPGTVRGPYNEGSLYGEREG
ncbi:hypothetical protein BDB00DRAFT_791956 [Zychaea mexicana]|uniref:uncharacterized protein n=1 Tax=Zychaea mexicana TaxID=64656 RepID=UPI0022FDF312|nr:uncharacterized protein BDB00DRAFT_791956 [Zychaea mexicana]KAI9488309.1 hypothetical protein BDB00DRAFT_791956 [Zychaea mexicana]